MSISQSACRLSQLPDQEVTMVGPSISWLSGNWLVRSVGQSDSRSGWLIVSWSAILFGDAFVGQSAGLFRVAANKPDRLTRVGRSLGSPYLSHAALQAPRPFGLIVVVSPSLWHPYKLLIFVLMPPPHPLSTQSSPMILPPLGDCYHGQVVVVLAVGEFVVVLIRSPLSLSLQVIIIVKITPPPCQECIRPQVGCCVKNEVIAVLVWQEDLLLADRNVQNRSLK